MNEPTFFQRLQANSPLRSILLGHVPDVDWPLIPTARLRASLDRAISSWRYIGHKFREARQNILCPVPLLAVLAYCGLKGGRVPTLLEATAIISSSPLVEGMDIESRIYSCYCSLLREFKAGIDFYDAGYQVIKNAKRDLSEGVDWIIRKDGRETLIQISHDGAASRYYYAKRKAHKTQADIKVLWARPNNISELHLCDIEDVMPQLLPTADVGKPSTLAV